MYCFSWFEFLQKISEEKFGRKKLKTSLLAFTFQYRTSLLLVCLFASSWAICGTLVRRMSCPQKYFSQIVWLHQNRESTDFRRWYGLFNFRTQQSVICFLLVFYCNWAVQHWCWDVGVLGLRFIHTTCSRTWPARVGSCIAVDTLFLSGTSHTQGESFITSQSNVTIMFI
jgi:hypothetical protein